MSTKGFGGVLSNSILKWGALVRCKKYDLDTSFSIFVFLGEVPHYPRLWLTDLVFCGTFDIFGSDVPNKDQAELVVKGSVHLNDKISERSWKKSLEPDIVVPYQLHEIFDIFLIAVLDITGLERYQVLMNCCHLR